MDHTIAHETYAAERYLLGEMAPEERDAFEEHYFSCKVCGEDIHTSSIFVENVKVVFRDESQKALAKRMRISWDWFKRLHLPVAVPAFAALAMAGVVVYQDRVMIPRLEVPQSMASPMILDGQTRAGLPKIEAGKPLRFQMLMPHTPEGDRVRVDLVNGRGQVLRSGSVESPDMDQPLDVYFPGRLEPGRYSLVVRNAGTEDSVQDLARNSFDIVPALNIPPEMATPPRPLEAPPQKKNGGRR